MKNKLINLRKSTKTKFFATAAMFLSALVGQAQTVAEANTAIDTATGDINDLYGIITTLIYAIAAIIALVGAIKIFIAWNSGERDVQKMIVGWFGACIFLVAVGGVIDAFFGSAA